jgi:tetratricopeptide (TPR) repeat protein
MKNHASADAIDPVASSLPRAADTRPERHDPRPRFGPRQGWALATVGTVALVAAFYLTRPPVVTTSSGTEAVQTTAPRPARAAAAAAREPPPSDPALARKVEGLARDGRWNVLVVYAAEWARRESRNADAWHHLGAGLAKLGRYDEAGAAAGRATDLAPERADVWRTLGEIEVARERPPQALAAFENAAARDAKDVASRVAAGALYASLGHLARARETFAAALAIDPRDVDALCGSAAVAGMEGRVNEEEGLLQRVRAQGRRCSRGSLGYAGGTPVGAAPAERRPATSR